MRKLMLAAVGLLAIATAAEAQGLRVETLPVAPPAETADGAPGLDHEGSTWPQTSTCRVVVSCSTGHHRWRSVLSHGFLGNGGSGTAQSVLLCDNSSDCGTYGGRYYTCTWTSGTPSCFGLGSFPPSGAGFRHYCHGATLNTVTCYITHD